MSDQLHGVLLRLTKGLAEVSERVGVLEVKRQAVTGGGPIVDHGALGGLGDDDHPQYLTQAEGDARYSQLGHTHTTERYVNFAFGAGVAIIPGAVPGVLHLPFTGTLVAWALLADNVGSITLDLWKTTYAAYATGAHPVDGDSMCGGHEPAIAASDKAQDLDLSDWATVAITAGDVIRVNVDANTDITGCTLSLTFTCP